MMNTQKNKITNSSSLFSLAAPDGRKNQIDFSSLDESSIIGNHCLVGSESSQDSIIIDVAKWFLNKESMSHKKLQKLCYYAYAWFLVFFNDIDSHPSSLNTLCQASFEAWVHGPVCPTLYHHYKGYGWNDIPKEEMKPAFPSDVRDLLEQIWNTYGDFTADQLEQLTHAEEPWQEARNGIAFDEPSNNVIDDNHMFLYYSKMMQ